MLSKSDLESLKKIFQQFHGGGDQQHETAGRAMARKLAGLGVHPEQIVLEDANGASVRTLAEMYSANTKLRFDVLNLNTELTGLKKKLSRAESDLKSARDVNKPSVLKAKLADAERRAVEAETKLADAERKLADAEWRTAETPKASAAPGQLGMVAPRDMKDFYRWVDAFQPRAVDGLLDDVWFVSTTRLYELGFVPWAKANLRIVPERDMFGKWMQRAYRMQPWTFPWVPSKSRSGSARGFVSASGPS